MKTGENGWEGLGEVNVVLCAESGGYPSMLLLIPLTNLQLSDASVILNVFKKTK